MFLPNNVSLRNIPFSQITFLIYEMEEIPSQKSPHFKRPCLTAGPFLFNLRITGFHSMAMSTPLATDVVAAAAEHLAVPTRFARQVIAALKAADRVDSARPISPVPTPLSITRILLALASPTIVEAVRRGERLGNLPLFSGDGQPTLEVALEDLVEEAAGWRNGTTDFRSGKIILGEGVAFIGDAIYRDADETRGLARFIAIDNQSIAALTRDLLPFKKV